VFLVVYGLMFVHVFVFVYVFLFVDGGSHTGVWLVYVWLLACMWLGTAAVAVPEL